MRGPSPDNPLPAEAVEFESAAGMLRLLLPADDQPPVIQHMRDSVVVREEPLNCTRQQATALEVLRALAPDIVQRPASFESRMILISFGDVGQVPDRAASALRVARVTDLVMDRLRRISDKRDLLMEIAAGYAVGMSSERSLDSRQRWIDECEAAARTLLGDIGAGTIRIYRLNGGSARRLDFASAAAAGYGQNRSPRVADGTEHGEGPVTTTPAWMAIRGARLHGPAASSAPDCIRMADVRFPPIWDVTNSLIATFGVEHYRHSGLRLLRTLDVLPAGADEGLKLELVHDVLDHADQLIEEFDRTGQPGFVTAWACFEVLASKAGLAAHLHALHILPTKLRRRRMLEVSHIPPGVNADKLSTMVEAMRPLARAMLCRVNLFDPSWTNVLAARPDLLGIEAAGSGGTAEDVRRAIDRFGAFCRKHRMPGYAIGLHHADHVRAAAEAGLRFLVGDAVVDPAHDAPRTRPYSWADFEAGAARESGTAYPAN